MLSNETKNYIETWSKDLNNVSGNSLEKVFTKFGHLYKIYGRLNNDASILLVKNGILKKKGGDKNSATENVIRFLTAGLIYNTFKNNNKSDIQALINILPRFRIKFTIEDQVWEQGVDEQLLNDLKSGSKEALVLSILQIIYYVRCNMEHSRKHKVPNQILLLRPLNNILKTLNDLLLIELSK